MTDERTFTVPSLTADQLNAILDERDKRLRQQLQDEVIRADQARFKRVWSTASGIRAEVARLFMYAPLQFDPLRTRKHGQHEMEEAIYDAVNNFEKSTGLRVALISICRIENNDDPHKGMLSGIRTDVMLTDERPPLADPIAEMCDHGHRYWKEGPGPMPCPACVLIGRDRALAEIEGLRRHVDVLRSQFFGIINLREIVPPQQYERIRKVLNETAPEAPRSIRGEDIVRSMQGLASPTITFGSLDPYRVLAEADRILYEWAPQLLKPPRPDLVNAREYVMTRIDEVLKGHPQHSGELPSAGSWDRDAQVAPVAVVTAAPMKSARVAIWDAINAALRKYEEQSGRCVTGVQVEICSGRVSNLEIRL